MTQVAVYFSPLARVHDTARLLPFDWVVVTFTILLPIVIVEVTKAFARRRVANVEIEKVS